MSSTVSINNHYLNKWTDDLSNYLTSFNKIKINTEWCDRCKDREVLRKIKKIRAIYLYLNRTILKVYTFKPRYQRLYKIAVNKRDEFVQDIKSKNIDPIYIRTCLFTLNKFGKFENCDVINYKYFILFIFKKMRICYDLSRFICSFI